MKKKNGFTLVELLAVIIVLAIIMVIAIPTVTNVMNNARKNAIVLEAEKMLNEVQGAYMSDIVLANGTTSGGHKCVMYDITSFGASTGSYSGYVWARFDDSNNVYYGVSVRDSNYEILGFETGNANGENKGYPTVSDVNTVTNASLVPSGCGTV